MGASVCPAQHGVEPEITVDADGAFLQNAKSLSALQGFFDWMEDHPEEVSVRPELQFVRDFLETWSEPVPAYSHAPDRPSAPFQPSAAAMMREEDWLVEEAYEEEAPDPHRWPEDAPPFPPKGSSRPGGYSRADYDRQAHLKQHGQEELERKNLPRALDLYSQAIAAADPTALLYAKRAEILLHMRKPRAAIADCTSALELNVDSGKAYRLRGIALRHLGLWAQAHEDLATGQRIDFDENTLGVQKFVDQQFAKIQEREAKRREALSRTEGVRRKRAAELIYWAQNRGDLPASIDSDCLIQAMVAEPNLQRALEDSSISEVLHQISHNPQALQAYEDEPAVMEVLQPVLVAMMRGAPHGSG